MWFLECMLHSTVTVAKFASKFNFFSVEWICATNKLTKLDLGWMNDWTKLRKKQKQDICTKRLSYGKTCVCRNSFLLFFVQMKMTCVLMKETITSWWICQCQRWWVSLLWLAGWSIGEYMRDGAFPLSTSVPYASRCMYWYYDSRFTKLRENEILLCVVSFFFLRRFSLSIDVFKRELSFILGDIVIVRRRRRRRCSSKKKQNNQIKSENETSSELESYTPVLFVPHST